MHDLCSDLLRDSVRARGPSDYWVHATLGEAELMLGKPSAAERWYREAAELARGQFRDVSSMRKQARLLAAHLLGHPTESLRWIEECLPIPPVVVLAGHLVEESGWRGAALEQAQMADVRKQVRSCIDGAAIGYAAVFSAADIAFLEEMLEQGNEVNVVLPYPKDEMLQLLSDAPFGGVPQDRLERLFQNATRLFVLGERCESEAQASSELAYRFTAGMALLRAQQLGTDILVLPSEDGTLSLSGASQAGIDRLWREHGEFVRAAEAETDRMPAGGDPSREIRAMLFADVKNYSKLNETQLLQFSEHFLQTIAQVIAACKDHIRFQKTVGDRVFLVFQNLKGAVDCALGLRDAVASVNWETRGLPKDMGFRISLDAGAVYRYRDPVSGHEDFCGKCVIRAARIEPITPPGEVYASESFAALVMAEGKADVRFEYAGQVPLPKDYGVIPVYHVQRSRRDSRSETASAPD